MDAEWYYSTGGAQQGPVTLVALRQQIQTGTINRDTLVWKAGMASWMPAGQVNEVFAGPPPLPASVKAPPPFTGSHGMRDSGPTPPIVSGGIPKATGRHSGASSKTVLLFVGVAMLLIGGMAVYTTKQRHSGILGYSGTEWGMSPVQVAQVTGTTLRPHDAEYPPGTQPEFQFAVFSGIRPVPGGKAVAYFYYFGPQGLVSVHELTPDVSPQVVQDMISHWKAEFGPPSSENLQSVVAKYIWSYRDGSRVIGTISNTGESRSAVSVEVYAPNTPNMDDVRIVSP